MGHGCGFPVPAAACGWSPALRRAVFWKSVLLKSLGQLQLHA